MLPRSVRQTIISWTKSVLGKHYAAKNLLDVAVAKPASHDRCTHRHMSVRDVLFSPSNMYSKKNQTEKLRIVDLVLTKAQPGAAGAVIMYVEPEHHTYPRLI
jgi:hypothetical protein